MSRIATLWRIATSWYISVLVAAAIGVVVGYFVFFDVFPGKPKIGVIDVSLPRSAIDHDVAFVISAYLDFVRRNDDIKAVVIRLNSPGSSGAAGEQLYVETRKLREEKPVVIAMGDLTASGAYMWSMGANHLFALPGSFVGSVGVIIINPGPHIPRRPFDEFVISTGPQKLSGGGSRRDFFGILEQSKENFYQLVAAERGGKLRISKEELLEARIYNGSEAVKLGLVDSIGGETEAIEKAASLAGISNYELVDVNTEVDRMFVEKFVRVFEPLFELKVSPPSVGGLDNLVGSSGTTDDSPGLLSGVDDIDALRRLFLPSGIEEIQEDDLSDIGLGLNTPRIYHLYVGPVR